MSRNFEMNFNSIAILSSVPVLVSNKGRSDRITNSNKIFTVKVLVLKKRLHLEIDKLPTKMRSVCLKRIAFLKYVIFDWSIYAGKSCQEGEKGGYGADISWDSKLTNQQLAEWQYFQVKIYSSLSNILQ